MEYYGRRNRRGRDRRTRQGSVQQAFVVAASQKRWSLLNSLSSCFIMTSLLAIIYLMLEYHCSVCGSQCDITNITRNIDNLTIDLSIMKESYDDLEAKVLKFSHELPRIQGQIEMLEAIAKMESGDFRRPVKNVPANKINVPPKSRIEGNIRNTIKNISKINNVNQD